MFQHHKSSLTLFEADRYAAMARKRWGPKGSRFWARVKKMPNGCWEWQGPKKNGYGYCPVGGKVKEEYAHRLAYYYAKGSPKGHVIRHTCDNPLCCRPSHLRAGTQKENIQDMVRKGRAKGGPRGSQKGEKNNGSKITEGQARTVLRLSQEGKRQAEIARMTGVKRSNVWAIINQKSWTHLTEGLTENGKRNN